MPRKRQLVSFDWAMKRLLRQKANYVVLEGFLTELMREDIKIQSFEDSVSNQSDKEDKYNCVDILAKDSKGQLILIEVQYDSEIDYFHRMLYGTSKLITDFMNAGEAYENVKKVISVNLIYFDLGQGKDYVYWGKTDFKGLHFQDELVLSQKQRNHFDLDTVSDIYPEYYILKLNAFDDYAKDNLDEWIYTLKNGELPPNFKAKGLEEAREILDLINMPDEERADYERFTKNKHVQASVVTSSIMRAEKAESNLKDVESNLKDVESNLKDVESNLKDVETNLKDAESDLKDVKSERDDAKVERIKMVQLFKSLGLTEIEIKEKLDEL